MAAIHTNKLGVPISSGQEPHTMRLEEADEGMPDFVRADCWSQETVPAVAGVLDEPIPRRYSSYAVPEHPTRVADLLCEPLVPLEWICFSREDERMTAPQAHVLVHAVPVCEAYVRVMPEETGERVPHVRGGAILP